MQHGLIIVGMNRLLVSLVFSSFILSVGPASVRAQDMAAAQSFEESPVQSETLQLQQSLPVMDEATMQDTEVTVMKDNYAGTNYVTPNRENLAKLYWRMNAFSLDDQSAIDSFLKINECELYKNFYSDDFEWANIRESTRDMLREKAATYPTQFKILVPIDLGRYDAERSGFELVNKTAFVNSRRVHVTGNSGRFECGRSSEVKGYPDDVILILNRPFTFDFIQVDEHVAQAFLLRKKYNKTPIPNELRSKGYKRLAYARMRVTFSRYQGTVRERNEDRAILYGTLDGIDVFEDPQEQMLLMSLDYK